MDIEERREKDRIRQRELYWSNPEKQRARKRKAQKEYDALHHAEKIARVKAWRDGIADRTRDYKRMYSGLPEPTRPEPKVCECCGEAPSGRYKNLCLDHCHTTGKFRAWLCDKCNRALGMVRDNPDILRKLAMILENFGTEECI